MVAHPSSDEWADVVETHRLESQDPLEWLRYGVGLLQLAGSGQQKQQQQAALAFEQARSFGATQEAIDAACRHSLALSLQAAFRLAGIPKAVPVAPLYVAVGPPVSLTVISARLQQLPLVIASLRNQTFRPVAVHLHVSEQGHLLDRGIRRDHPLLQHLQLDPWIHVHWGPNLGPYRKILPFLQQDGYGSCEGDNDAFITVDDDTLYPPRFVEYLCRNHARYDCIVAHRGRRMKLCPEQGFAPYAQWHDGLREPRLANLPTGQSGVLYRRRYFPHDLEVEAALAVAPTHDDLWLRWITARQGIPSVILQPNAAARTQELAFPSADASGNESGEALWFAYNSSEAERGSALDNDAANTLTASYFHARGFDFESLLRREQEEMADLY